MRLRTQNRRGLARRAIATLVALLIGVAQLVGAFHSHEWGSALGHGGKAPVAVDGRLCPVCQLASHGQVGFSAPPRLSGPVASIERTPPPPKLDLVKLFLASPLGRAPPVTD